ncbi:hypothetical protein F5148DRAFT_133804 [Russula earlei]|uniref:Uncharacterized protein n=1 Tax=Russula earlei TaxID=71964 RepID=A0ACC0TQN4_9AGAM|nr:hypothetical protein F5148DRAFT_133804 [Russula earlei]
MLIIESEYQYWSFVMSHPVHVMLPSESVHEAINVLTWFYTNRLQQSPHPSAPPFSQEECQELLTQLRSSSDMSTLAVVRTRVVSSVLVRVVAWRQGRQGDGATFQDPRQSNNDPSAGISPPLTRGEFIISFVCSGLLNFSWNDHIVKVSAREVAYVVLVALGFVLGRLLA